MCFAVVAILINLPTTMSRTRLAAFMFAMIFALAEPCFAQRLAASPA
jgi:hypothetical protein